MRDALDQSISEVGAARGVPALRLQHEVGSIDQDFLAAQQQIQRLGHLLAG